MVFLDRFFGKQQQSVPEQIEAPPEVAQQRSILSAINSAVTTIISGSRSLSGGNDLADTLHNVYADFGYPSQVSFYNLWHMYRRLGVARNAVEKIPAIGWSTPPTVTGSESFNREFETLVDNFYLWQRIKGVDIRQRVGRYAGAFFRVRDGKQPHEPFESKLSGLGALVSIMPLYESQLFVTEVYTDPNDPNFGLPKMYHYNAGIVGNRNELTASSIRIHPSRIVIAAEGADDGSIMGIPVLESVYNSLMDIRKIIGAGGEGFYKNAAQSVLFDLKDPASALQYREKLDEFNDEFDKFSRARFRKGMWTPGMTAKVLDSNLKEPKQFFDDALNDIAAGTDTPATILIGKQTGRLASDEDSKQFLAAIQARRLSFMTELVAEIVDWLMEAGILVNSEYDIEWDDLLARSDSEKISNAKDLSSINKTEFDSGNMVPFSPEEIRIAAGYDPEELDDDMTEELPDDFTGDSVEDDNAA